MSEINPSVAVASASAASWFAALRPVQWVKNLLIVTPAVFAQVPVTFALGRDLAVGFVALSLAASAGYLVNDVRDRAGDRMHPVKCRRPIAAGRLAPAAALAAASLLAVLALAVAWLAGSAMLAAVLVVYLAASAAYTLVVKRWLAVDVAHLAGLYLLRLVAGAVVAGVALSGWLSAFAFALFVALALAKRLDELATVPASAGLAGRAYEARHRVPVRRAAGLAAGLALAVLVAYLGWSEAAADHYSEPALLWAAACLLLVWLVHMLRAADAGRLGGDPVAFAVRDPISLALAAALMLAVVAAR